mgnify:CR=1 FL=1
MFHFTEVYRKKYKLFCTMLVACAWMPHVKQLLSSSTTVIPARSSRLASFVSLSNTLSTLSFIKPTTCQSQTNYNHNIIIYQRLISGLEPCVKCVGDIQFLFENSTPLVLHTEFTPSILYALLIYIYIYEIYIM